MPELQEDWKGPGTVPGRVKVQVLWGHRRRFRRGYPCSGFEFCARREMLVDRLSTDKVEHPWMSVEHYPDRHPRLSRRRFVPVLPDEKEVHHQLRVSPMVRRTVVNNRHFAISQFFDFGDDITLFIIIYILCAYSTIVARNDHRKWTTNDISRTILSECNSIRIDCQLSNSAVSNASYYTSEVVTIKCTYNSNTRAPNETCVPTLSFEFLFFKQPKTM